MKKRLNIIVVLLLVLAVVSGATFYLKQAKLLADSAQQGETIYGESQFPDVPLVSSLPETTKPNITKEKVWDMYSKAIMQPDIEALTANSSYTGLGGNTTRYNDFRNESIDKMIEKAVADQFYWMALKTTYTTQANAVTNKPDLTSKEKVSQFIASKTGKSRGTEQMVDFVFKNRNNLPLVLASIDHQEARFQYETAALLDELGVYKNVDPQVGITAADIDEMLIQISKTAIINNDGILPFVIRFYSINSAQGTVTIQGKTNNEELSGVRVANAQTVSLENAQANANMAQAAEWVNPTNISKDIYPIYDDTMFLGTGLITGNNAKSLEAELSSYNMSNSDTAKAKLALLANGDDPASQKFVNSINKSSTVLTSFGNGGDSSTVFSGFVQTAHAATWLENFNKLLQGLDQKLGLSRAAEWIFGKPRGLSIDSNTGEPSITSPVTRAGEVVGTIVMDPTKSGQAAIYIPSGATSGQPVSIYYNRSNGTSYIYDSSPAQIQTQIQALENEITGLNTQFQSGLQEGTKLYGALSERMAACIKEKRLLESLRDGTPPPEGVDLLVSKVPLNSRGEGNAIIQMPSQFFRIDPFTGKGEIGLANVFGADIWLNTDMDLVGTYPVEALSYNSKDLSTGTSIYLDSSGNFAIGQSISLNQLGIGIGFTINQDGDIGGAIDLTKFIDVKGMSLGISFDKEGFQSATIGFGSVAGVPIYVTIGADGRLSFGLGIDIGPIKLPFIGFGMNDNNDLVLSWLGGSWNISRFFGISDDDARPKEKPTPALLDDGTSDFATFWYLSSHTHACMAIPPVCVDRVWNEVHSANVKEQQARAQVIVDTYKELIYRPPTQTEFANLYFYINDQMDKTGLIDWSAHYTTTENAAIEAITKDSVNQCKTASVDPKLKQIIPDALKKFGLTNTVDTSIIKDTWACAIKATNKTIYKESDFDLKNWLKNIQNEINNNPNPTQPIATPTEPDSHYGQDNSGSGSGGGILGSSTLISTGLSLMVIIGATILILVSYEVWQYRKSKKSQLPPTIPQQ